eukprot:365202-Chlamydomonas_euryale.AAC.21
MLRPFLPTRPIDALYHRPTQRLTCSVNAAMACSVSSNSGGDGGVGDSRGSVVRCEGPSCDTGGTAAVAAVLASTPAPRAAQPDAAGRGSRRGLHATMASPSGRCARGACGGAPRAIPNPQRQQHRQHEPRGWQASRHATSETLGCLGVAPRDGGGDRSYAFRRCLPARGDCGSSGGGKDGRRSGRDMTSHMPRRAHMHAPAMRWTSAWRLVAVLLLVAAALLASPTAAQIVFPPYTPYPPQPPPPPPPPPPPLPPPPPSPPPSPPP